MSLLSSLFRSGPDPKALVKDGAVVVDVRNPDEWNEGHLEQSTSVPLPELGARLKEIEKLVGGDKSKVVVVVCRSGGRAEVAKTILRQNGFQNVHNAGAWTSLR